MFDYTTQRSRAPGAKARLGAADYKILLYVTPKSTRKLISSYDLYNISPPSRLEDTCRVAPKYACVYVTYVCVRVFLRVYELRACQVLNWIPVCVYMYMCVCSIFFLLYSSLYYSLACSFISLFFFSLLYSQFSHSRLLPRVDTPKIRSLYSICKNIQVKL